MASVLNFPEQRYFEHTLVFSPDGNHDKKSAVSWKSFSVNPGDLSDLIGIGRTLALFHRGMTSTQVYWHQWSVRTAARDSDPYNPLAFYTEPIEELGLWSRSPGTQLLDFDIALRIVKRTVPGRLGACYLRGVLAEQDVNTTAGKYFLTGTELPNQWEVVYENTLEPLLGGTIIANVRIGLYGPNGEFPRLVESADMGAVSIVKRNHRYYDRASAVASPAPELTPEQLAVSSHPNQEWVFNYTPPATPPWEE